MISIYEFVDYKLYLAALEQDRTSFPRGFRSRLSESLNVQSAYISQVLNTHANFSLEQGFKLAEFFRLNELETRYFLLMVEFARAGSKELKEFFRKDLESLQAEHLNLKDRIPKSQSLTEEGKSVYYSSWIYAAVHVLITIPKFRTTLAISEALEIDQRVATDALDFLVNNQLVLEEKGQFLPGPTQIHLEKTSPHIRQHHSNWRIAAIRSLTSFQESEIHYSTVSSLSFEDAKKLKLKLVDVIQDYVSTIQGSKEETLYNFNLDFYSLIGLT